MTAEKSLIQDLVALQAELPVIGFDSQNPHFKSKFASLKAIREIVQPLLAKHGFAWVAKPSTDEDGELALEYALMHTSGEAIAGRMSLIGGATPQSQGSALTYARRYALSAVLGIVADEDDDANHATDTASSSRASAPSGVGSATSAQGKRAEVLGPCAVCEMDGLKANGDKTPALFKNLATGKISCNGKYPDGSFANHKPERTEPVGDPDEIPF